MILHLRKVVGRGALIEDLDGDQLACWPSIRTGVCLCTAASEAKMVHSSVYRIIVEEGDPQTDSFAPAVSSTCACPAEQC
jgi:hypothetical protein